MRIKYTEIAVIGDKLSHCVSAEACYLSLRKIFCPIIYTYVIGIFWW